MKFACLVYHDEAKLEALGGHGVALTAESIAYDSALDRAGHLIMAQALRSPKKAKCVEMRDADMAVIDGPFAETKEQLLGFVLIEAKDEAEALRLAAGIPLARTGTIELREFLDLT